MDLTVLSVRGAPPSAVRLRARHVVLGGYTGRSVESRNRHIAELRTIGIEAPERVPAFWPVSSWLVTTTSAIEVQGARTSGEVEFALIHLDGRWLVTVASDHTDREFEAISIPRSKQLCPKVIGRELLPLDELSDRWDEIIITSEVTDGDGRWRPYQSATLDLILPPDELLAACLGRRDAEDGMVLLSGTVPLLDGETRCAEAFRASLDVPGWDGRLRLDYRVHALPERADIASVGHHEEAP